MIRFSKLFFGFTVFVLLLWLLPWAYNFAFYKPERTPFTLWSCVVGDFAVVDFAGDGIVRRDRGGRTYTSVEELDRPRRCRELARLTGGAHVTAAMLAGAEELIAGAEQYKASLNPAK